VCRDVRHVDIGPRDARSKFSQDPSTNGVKTHMPDQTPNQLIKRHRQAGDHQ